MSVLEIQLFSRGEVTLLTKVIKCRSQSYAKNRFLSQKKPCLDTVRDLKTVSKNFIKIFVLHFGYYNY